MAWKPAEIIKTIFFKSTLLIVKFSNNKPVPILISASNVFPERKYKYLKVKKPDSPIPPRVTWKMPIRINIDETHASEKLLYDNFAFIGPGHGCKGFTLLIKLDDNLKTDLS